MEDVTSCRGEFRRVPYKPSSDPSLLKDGTSCNQAPHPATWPHQPPGRASLKVAGARQQILQRRPVGSRLRIFPTNHV
ncbi:hypothetical protein DSO57_1038690 [Entomophthora muscae]|uniref:Uncharacterized protein n=1 Tax=Entomophthora muscae TaxID=34485 RepID=A0ACC2TX66_9FUNG|nr:hypothetical protein DSO57_1038690 [Entomophthora muscae]